MPVALASALAWLLVGCGGLLWTIAFTTDPRSMTIGLAVWVFCFVAPSTLATVAAYRLEEVANEGGEADHRATSQGARHAHAQFTAATGD